MSYWLIFSNAFFFFFFGKLTLFTVFYQAVASEPSYVNKYEKKSVLGNYKFVTETSSANTEKEVWNDTEAEVNEPQHTVIQSHQTRNNHHKIKKVVDLWNYGLL